MNTRRCGRVSEVIHLLTLVALDVELVDLLGELVLLDRLGSGHGQRKTALEVLHFVHLSAPRTPEKRQEQEGFNSVRRNTLTVEDLPDLPRQVLY